MSDRPRDPLGPEAASPAERAAADVGALVAEKVRRAIESAERSADELQRQAFDRASADQESVHRTAAMVLDRIDLVEAKVGRLLQELRDEVARTTAEADGQEPLAPPAGLPPDADAVPAPNPGPEEPPTLPHESQDQLVPGLAPRRRRGPFSRHRASVRCAVCGRAPRTGEETREGWRLTGKLHLCPDCRHEGWQLPPGARLPYRPARAD